MRQSDDMCPLGYIVDNYHEWQNDRDNMIGVIPATGEILTWDNAGLGVVVEGAVCFTREQYEERKTLNATVTDGPNH